MVETEQTQATSVFPVELLRDRLLPELFQEDEVDVLYWAGKALARQYSFVDVTEVITFFAEANFGELVLKKAKATEITFHLSGATVDTRLASRPDANFSLESGFLAETCQRLASTGAEAQANVEHDHINLTVWTEEPVELPM